MNILVLYSNRAKAIGKASYNKHVEIDGDHWFFMTYDEVLSGIIGWTFDKLIVREAVPEDVKLVLYPLLAKGCPTYNLTTHQSGLYEWVAGSHRAAIS